MLREEKMDLDKLVRLDVNVKEHGYPVFIGSDYLMRIGELIGPYVQSKKVFYYYGRPGFHAVPADGERKSGKGGI